MAQTGGCRAGAPRPLEDRRWLPAVLLALLVLGYAAAQVFVWSRPAADEFRRVRADFGLWVVLVSLVAGYALAAGAYAVVWLRGWRQVAVTMSGRDVVGWIASVALVLAVGLGAIMVGNATTATRDNPDWQLAHQSVPLTLVSAGCSLPVLATFLALRATAVRDANWTAGDLCALRLIIRLRTELRSFLAITGGLLTLIVVATGVRRETLLVLEPAYRVPPEAILIYGAVFAVLIGLAFAAANSAIDARAGRLLEASAALPAPSADDLAAALQRRSDLAGLLGLDSSRRTFESGVVVAAPLLSAIIAAAVGS